MPELKGRGNINLSLESGELFVGPKRDNYLFVASASDLPSASGGEHTLPADTLVEISGTVDIGSNALRLSKGTVIVGRDIAHDAIQSSADGVIRASSVDSDVILREFGIVATGGKAIDLTGTIEHQLNMFYVGFFGVSAGNITGFNVQAAKSCYVEAANGFTFDGTTAKLFVDGTPFFDTTGAAITLAATLDCRVADIRVSFFKFDSPGIGVKAETGYTVDRGVYTGNLIDGTAVPLDGLSPADVNWKMNDNTGLRDSRTAGQLSLDAPATTTISAVDTPTKISGATSKAALTERLDGSTVDNRLQYEGDAPALVGVQTSVNIEGGNNVTGALMIAKNGTVVNESKTQFKIGTGDAQASVAAFAVVELDTDDYVEAWIENQSGSANFTVNSMSLVGRA